MHKEPITDIGKKSKPGKLALVRVDKWEDYSAQGVGQIVTVPQEKAGNYKSGDLLQTVFRNGIIQTYPTWDEVSKRAAL